jgi:hypothetical protein
VDIYAVAKRDLVANEGPHAGDDFSLIEPDRATLDGVCAGASSRRCGDAVAVLEVLSVIIEPLNVDASAEAMARAKWCDP